MNETKQYFNSAVQDYGIQSELWNSKFQILADTLMHHIREEEEDDRHESKGVYIDFQQLK